MKVEFEHDSPQSETLIIIFASAGLAFGGAPVQEFGKTFSNVDPGYAYDLCWVFDTKADWFGSMTSAPGFAPFVERVHSYQRCITMGESKGALGALLLRQFIDNWDRTLAFGPQYSVSSPYIAFDTALGLPSEIPVKSLDLALPPRLQTGEANRIALLFGADCWADFVHASFFRLAGYNPRFVEGAHHSVAARLKPLGLLAPAVEDFLSDKSDGGQLKSIEHLLKDQPSDRVRQLDLPNRF